MIWSDLKGESLGGLYSAGLDSQTSCCWLKHKVDGIYIRSYTIHYGQPDETDVNVLPARMLAAHADEAYLIDGRQLLAKYAIKMLQGMGYHEGFPVPYWNTTGIARMATVKAALPDILAHGAFALTHGATGKGNDQVRFELATKMLAGNRIDVYAPWRDPDFLKELGGRKLMVKYAKKMGLPIPMTMKKRYSTDTNFLGCTHEAVLLELLSTPTRIVKPIMGVYPYQAPRRFTTLAIGFREGVPVSVNGVEINDLYELIMLLNKIGGENGIGIGVEVIENRRVGMKSRGVYEAPGMTLLGIFYNKLLESVLDDDRRMTFSANSRAFGHAIYWGEWFGPQVTDLLNYFASIAKNVTGTVAFSLRQGIHYYEGMEPGPNCLYCSAVASMEDEKSTYNHEDAQGYLRVCDSKAVMMHDRGLVREAIC
jgi:argininosuccinate synthase